MRRLYFLCAYFLVAISNALAQPTEDGQALQVVNSFSSGAIKIVQGPLTKILAALILLAGVGGLLRGRHKIAISCGIAFIILLFLPMLLQQIGNGN